MSGGVEEDQPESPRTRILVAYDRWAARRSMVGALARQIVFSLRETTTVDEAVREAERWHPDVILVGAEMNGGEGLRALPRLRQAAGSSRIVLFTLAEEPLPAGSPIPGDPDVVVAPAGDTARLLAAFNVTVPPPPQAGEVVAVGAQLDAFFHGAPLGMALLDSELRYVRVNPTLARWSATRPEAMLGLTPTQAHGPRAEPIEALLREAAQSGSARTAVPISRTPGAQSDVRHWRLYIYPIPSTAGSEAVCLIAEDATTDHVLRQRLEASDRAHRQLADDLQRSLQPPVLPRLAGAELASIYRPAAGGAVVGGDFYDVFRTGPSAWVMVIGDVQGKGPVAASMTAAARYGIRAAAAGSHGPAEVLRTVNDVLLSENEEESLCTLLYVAAERQGDAIQLRCASAGHPLPLILRRDGTIDRCGQPGFVLGVSSPLEVTETDTTLRPWDTLIMYTDGLTEARFRNASGRLELLGEDRLRAILSTCQGQTAAAIAARLDQAVVDFQGGETPDDLALLILQAQPGRGDTPH